MPVWLAVCHWTDGIPALGYFHLEALLLSVTEGMHLLYATARAVEQEIRVSPGRVTLVGLCSVHRSDLCASHQSGCEFQNLSWILPETYPSRARTSWESCETHVYNHWHLHRCK